MGGGEGGTLARALPHVITSLSNLARSGARSPTYPRAHSARPRPRPCGVNMSKHVWQGVMGQVTACREECAKVGRYEGVGIDSAIQFSDSDPVQ